MIGLFLQSVFILSVTFIGRGIYSANFETSKVIVHKPSYSENSHFGFTVAGYKVEKDSWILIGAPLALRERNHGNGHTVTKSREGAVYRCRINTENSCYMLPFDKKDWTETRDHYGVFYSENKTDQLLGATLLVSDDIIMTCAPNYRYVTRMLGHDEFRYEPTGTCFTLKDKMRKLEEHSPCRNSMWGHHRLGYCQAGFSGAISKNDSSLFISGPGAWYWQGMVSSINLFNKDIKHRFPERSGEGSTDDSYRGYAIDVGHFDDDIFEDVVVSSPRGNGCKGYVEIFSSNLRLLTTLYGTQIGSYFGASVIAVDLNNDRATDIIVGSPMYKKDTENYDIGRIDIFLREKKQQHVKSYSFRQISINGFRAKSRFGTSLAKLGDINDDGFNDIAVGAPYDGEDGEESGGIVYIYHGKSDGLSKEPDQIIKGSNYGLRTFGFSISGGLDLDGNKYPDLIVGAYKSDAAVFIRSKSVIKTIITTHTNPKVIDFESNNNYCDKNKTRLCIDFEYCIQYFGKAVPQTIRMLISLELDIDKYHNKSLIRSTFSDTKTNFFEQNYTFKASHKKCFNQLISIKKNIRDKLIPIKSRLNLTLPNYNSDWELMPMFNSLEDHSKIHEIRFLRNCGPDDICVPNLQVSASTPSKKYVFGSHYNIDLNIRVENTKEDAFEAQCHIILPNGVDYVKAFISQSSGSQHLSLPCYQNKIHNETKITCDIGNPMLGGSSKSFTIRVAPQSILFSQEMLKFNISASSSNKEDKSTTFDNEHFVYVVLEAIPSITLIGKNYQEQVIYESKTSELKDELLNETDIGPEIVHEYKLINKGPSQFLRSELLIAWQKEIKNSMKSSSSPFLYLMESPYTEGPISCFTQYLDINTHNFSKSSGDKLKNPEKYFILNKEAMSGSRGKRYLGYNDKLNIFDFIPSSIYMSGERKTGFDEFDENVECSSGMVKQSTNDQMDSLEINNTPFESGSESANGGRSKKYLNMMKSEMYDSFCSSLHCYIGPMSKDESAVIRLRFRLWSRSLARNPDTYKIKTYAMAAVTEIPYSRVALNLDQFQNSVKIETIAYPKERKQLFQNIDIRIILLSIIGGIILLIFLIIILWCCGFFKRFEPINEESKKSSDLLTTDEEISSSNDVIDVSKECSKLEARDHNEPLLLRSSGSSSGGDEPLLNPYASSRSGVLRNHGKRLIQTAAINESNCDDEIYGFTPLNNNNELSTFQGSSSSSKHHMPLPPPPPPPPISSSASILSNGGGLLTSIQNGSNNNKFANPIYSFYQDGNQSSSVNESLLSTRNFFTTNVAVANLSNDPSMSLSLKLNKKAALFAENVQTDIYTSKLPPVPKRKNLANSNASLINQNRYGSIIGGCGGSAEQNGAYHHNKTSQQPISLTTSSSSSSSNNAHKSSMMINNNSDSALLSTASSSSSASTSSSKVDSNSFKNLKR